MIKQTIFTILSILIISGCAQRTINTEGTTNDIPNKNNIETYENVDPYGNGSGDYSNTQYIDEYTIDGNYDGSSMIQNIYFNSDQYNISANKLGVISHNASLLRGKNSIKIEGHCDASGTDEYNYALGLRRAKAAKDALQNSGVVPEQVTLVSMGESSPECVTSSSSECYAKNRRVEFKVIQ